MPSLFCFFVLASAFRVGCALPSQSQNFPLHSCPASSQPNSWGIPKLLIVGRTRVGKGTFILTSHRILGEKCLLPNIVSHGAVSHTQETAAYHIRLNGHDVEMIDTVGFDDSSGTNVSQDTLLRFLAETKTAIFYPPLVMLTTLSAIEKDLVKKMEDVFSKVVVAFRLQDEDRLETIEKEVPGCGIRPIKIFHLQEFVPKKIDSEGKSREQYESNVSEILKFYETLTPTRDLNFSKPMFAGERRLELHRTEAQERTVVKEKTDKKTETKIVKSTKIVTLADGGHYEENGGSATTAACLESVSHVLRGTGILGLGLAAVPGLNGDGAEGAAAVPFVGMATSIGAAVLSAGAQKARGSKKWVEDKREEVVQEEVAKDFEVNTIVVEEWLETYERKIYALWYVLAGEIEIFKEFEEGSWEFVKEELLKRAYKESTSAETL